MSTIDEIMLLVDDIEDKAIGCERGDCEEPVAERASLRDLIATALADAERKGAEAMRAEIEAHEPACWAVIDPTGGGSVEYTAAWREACHEHIGNMITEADMPEAAGFLVRPLFTRPVPAQAVPERKP